MLRILQIYTIFVSSLRSPNRGEIKFKTSTFNIFSISSSILKISQTNIQTCMFLWKHWWIIDLLIFRIMNSIKIKEVYLLKRVSNVPFKCKWLIAVHPVTGLHWHCPSLWYYLQVFSTRSLVSSKLRVAQNGNKEKTPLVQTL